MTPEEALRVFTDCKRAYQLTFGTPAGKAAFDDLAKYCRGKQSCVAAANNYAPIDVYRTFLLEGRRDVILMIQDYLDLTPEQLVERYTKRLSTGEMTDG